MSATARAATLRSRAPALRAASRASAYSTVSAQTLAFSSSRRTTLPSPPLSATQLISPFAALPLTRSFHVATALWQQKQQQPGQEQQKEEKKDEDGKSEDKSEGEQSKEEKGEEKKEDAPPPPPHGDKTPWQVFRETLQTEFKASKEWNESTKALASSAHEFSENENVKRARAAYEAASGAAQTRTSAALKSTGQVIGKSAAWTWNTPVVKGVRKGVTATGSGIERATRPVRQTEAYKNVKETIDDGSSSRYGGWVEKEERRKQRKRREEMEAKAGKRRSVPMEEDPEAGTNVTLHKDAAWKESWRDFRDSNPVMQRLFSMKEVYNESENPLISTARSISDRVAGFFAENETAMVIKKFREIDPNFQMEEFIREMREYMLPEVLDAYVKGDVETLKLWLSDAQYHVYAALAQQYTTAGLKSDGRILDIRGVDVSHARLLEPGEIPVFVVTCRTQEVHVYRNVKSGELAAGMEDKVQLVTYAIGMTRIPEEVNNPETRGWRLIELQKAARDYI
ncbi:protein translocase subunit [Penicillium riverlandense]|uniref:protein translocase subunit n=1 Tax=Penicillium riverlandense TaxID=1903569 RepID=UPI00254735D1|nr:protein translocase subunit [Penicillium riverlandense]KAJ5811715.1 protein translocase subunit [Penicillium riverlandense]